MVFELDINKYKIYIHNQTRKNKADITLHCGDCQISPEIKVGLPGIDTGSNKSRSAVGLHYTQIYVLQQHLSFLFLIFGS